MAIVRFKKWKGSYRKQSSFNVSNEKQAHQITDVFEAWYPKIRAATGGAGGGDEDADTPEAEAED
jgi:hypothetical protein